MSRHPNQPTYLDGKVLRFRPNKIVKYLVDANLANLNHIAAMDFSDEDRAQFDQLHGYSVDAAPHVDDCVKSAIESSHENGTPYEQELITSLRRELDEARKGIRQCAELLENLVP